MQVSVHVDKEFLAMRSGSTSPRVYRCIRENLEGDQLEPYLTICDLFKELVPLYVNEPEGYRLMTESIVLSILYHLVRHFSFPATAQDFIEPPAEQTRIQQILNYIEEHYAEHISLQGISSEFGLSREYFSRLFHKSLGISFSEHVNRVGYLIFIMLWSRTMHRSWNSWRETALRTTNCLSGGLKKFTEHPRGRSGR